MVLPSKKYKIDFTENSYRWEYWIAWMAFLVGTAAHFSAHKYIWCLQMVFVWRSEILQVAVRHCFQFAVEFAFVRLRLQFARWLRVFSYGLQSTFEINIFVYVFTSGFALDVCMPNTNNETEIHLLHWTIENELGNKFKREENATQNKQISHWNMVAFGMLKNASRFFLSGFQCHSSDFSMENIPKYYKMLLFAIWLRSIP